MKDKDFVGQIQAIHELKKIKRSFNLNESNIGNEQEKCYKAI